MQDAEAAQRNRPYFLERDRDVEAFEASVFDIILALRDKFVKETIPPENIHPLKHGRSSNFRPDAPTEHTQTFAISAEMAVRYSDLVNNDLSILPKTIEDTVESFRDQFMRMIYSTVAETCDKSGNVVDARQTGSLAASFMELMEKIEVSVGPDGKVSMPEFHASPEMAHKMFADLQAQPPEFAQKFEQIKAAKVDAAFEREAARKKRFKFYPQ